MKAFQIKPGKEPKITLKLVGAEIEVKVRYSQSGPYEDKHSTDTTKVLAYLKENYPEGTIFRVLQPASANNFNSKRLLGIWKVEKSSPVSVEKPLDSLVEIVHNENVPTGETNEPTYSQGAISASAPNRVSPRNRKFKTSTTDH